MSETTSKGTFLKQDSKVTGYMAYPRFLLQTDLNETARMIYVLLLDRARLSINRGGWADEEGNVYIIYDIKSLAADCRKSEGTVKTALHALEKADLIFREKQEVGKSRKLYVKTRTENYPSTWSENHPYGGQKTVSYEDRKLTPNKNNIIKTNVEKVIIRRKEKVYDFCLRIPSGKDRQHSEGR